MIKQISIYSSSVSCVVKFHSWYCIVYRCLNVTILRNDGIFLVKAMIFSQLTRAAVALMMISNNINNLGNFENELP